MTQYMRISTKRFLFVMVFATVLLCVASGTISAQTIDDCIECHMDKNLTKTDAEGKVHSLFVDKQGFIKSIHGEMEYTCVDCHEGVKAMEHPKDGIADVKCAECHEEVTEEYNKSHHGQLDKSKHPDAPECYDCHTIHEVRYPDDPESSTHPDNLIKTCGACHEEQSGIPFIDKLSLSVKLKAHAKVNMASEFTTRLCGDCHFEVINHGNDELEPAECAKCHSVDKPQLIYGSTHAPGLLSSPTYNVLVILGYIAAIIIAVVYYRNNKKKAKPDEQTQQSS